VLSWLLWRISSKQCWNDFRDLGLLDLMMPLVFIVFCSSEDSHSNIEHSTVHEMQCIKKASGKIYNMQYFRIEEQHKFWQCMCSATRAVLMLLHNEYFYFLQMKYIQHAVHHMYKWVAINMRSIPQEHYLHIRSTNCFVFFSQQRMNSRFLKYALHYYAHETFNILRPARVQT